MTMWKEWNSLVDFMRNVKPATVDVEVEPLDEIIPELDDEPETDEINAF